MARFFRKTEEPETEEEFTEAPESAEEILFASDLTETDTEEAGKTVFLDLRQKMYTLAAAAVSFAIFFIILFPYENIVRSVLNSENNPVKIQYSSLNLSLFGESRLRNAVMVTRDGTKLNAQEAIIDVSLLRLIPGSLKGELFFDTFRLQLSGTGLEAGALEIITDLKNYLKPADQYDGTVTINANKASFTSFPAGIPLPLNASDLIIERLQLIVTMKQGSYSIDNSSLKSNLFTIQIKAGGKLAPEFTRSPLNGTMCLTPVSGLENVNPSVYGMYLMLGGGSFQPQVCFGLSGTIGAPAANPVSGSAGI